MGTAVKIPTLKDELIKIQNNPNNDLLSRTIDELKMYARVRRNFCHIFKYNNEIIEHLKSQGLIAYEKEEGRPGTKYLYVTWN